jgi:3-mercaptopyruvate sulfurtransferase SseA
MRKLSAVVAASLFALAAGAQMKQPQPVPATTAPSVQPLQAPAPAASLESARRINRDEAMKLVREKKAVWVDVRNKESYELGHLPGAYHIPENELVGRLKELPAGKMIITYCA